MATCTTNFLLPYQEGSDRPCGAIPAPCQTAEIWCDFVTLVEAQLDAFDNTVARTDTTVPMARVSRGFDAPVVIAGAGDISFLQVDVDTDNMVDLETFSGITVQRNGIYEINAIATVEQHITDGEPEVRIVIGNLTEPAFGPPGTTTLGVARGFSRDGPEKTALDLIVMRVSTLWLFTDATPRIVSAYLPVALANYTLRHAMLEVIWRSELP